MPRGAHGREDARPFRIVGHGVGRGTGQQQMRVRVVGDVLHERAQHAQNTSIEGWITEILFGGRPSQAHPARENT